MGPQAHSIQQFQLKAVAENFLQSSGQNALEIRPNCDIAERWYEAAVIRTDDALSR